MRAALDEADKAKYHEGRAHAIRANAAISSDDEDAVIKLKAKLEEAEANQAHMKAVNRVVKGKKLSDDEKVARMRDEHGLKEAVAREILKPDFAGRVGYADYQLANNNANIRRMKARIAELEQRQAEPEQAPPKAAQPKPGSFEHEIGGGPSKAADDGPKEGDTKVENGKTYQLIDGRWHLVEADGSDPSAFVSAPSGGLDFGSIEGDAADAIGQPAGSIRLQNGWHDDATGRGFGKVHIDRAMRAEQLAQNGYASTEALIEDVGRNYNAIYEGKNGTYILAKQNGKAKIAFVTVKAGESGVFYSVGSGLVSRDGYLTKKPRVWDGAPTRQPKSPSAFEGQQPKATSKIADPEDSDNPNSPNYRYRDTGIIAGARKFNVAATFKAAAKDGQRVRTTDGHFAPL